MLRRVAGDRAGATTPSRLPARAAAPCLRGRAADLLRSCDRTAPRRRDRAKARSAPQHDHRRRGFGLGLVDFDLLLQRVNEVFLEIVGRELRCRRSRAARRRGSCRCRARHESGAPDEIARARWLAIRTRSKRLSTLSMQSSTVTRAMAAPGKGTGTVGVWPLLHRETRRSKLFGPDGRRGAPVRARFPQRSFSQVSPTSALPKLWWGSEATRRNPAAS